MSGDDATDAMNAEMSVHSSNDESSSGTKESSRDNFLFDEAKAIRAFALWVSTDDVPPQMIAGHYFGEFVHLLNPSAQFGPESVKMVKAECLNIFKEEKVKIKQILAAFDGQISLSIDVLRTPVGDDYMCLTAHFIDDGWKVKKWVLKFCRIWGEEDQLPRLLLQTISDWDIESKISTITMKNSSAYDETVKALTDCVQGKKKLQLNRQLFRVYCCADMLSVMVQDVLNEIPEIIEDVSGLVAGGRPTPFWHITYVTLKDAFELYSVGEFSGDGYDGIEIPPTDDWKKVEGVLKLLESVHNVAKRLFETKYLTPNIYLHNLRELRASLIQESTSSDSFIKPIAEKMLQKFDRYWNDMFLLLAITTVMDPRFKVKYFEFSSSKYEEGDCNSRITTVLEAIQTLYDEYPTPIDDNEKYMSDSSTSFDSKEPFDGEGSSSPPPKSRCVVEECNGSKDGFNWVQEYHQFIQCNGQPRRSELDLYLEEPVIPWIENFNIMRWWRASSPKYPILSGVARDLLSIPISVVTSYEAYCTKEREVDRQLLVSGHDVMGALMCTRSWNLKYRYHH